MLRFFVECYRPQLWFWEVVALVRRAVLFAVVLVPTLPLRLYVYGLVGVVSAALQYVLSPLQTPLENGIELLSHASVALLALSHASLLYDTQQQAMSWVLAVLTAGPFVAMVVAIVHSRWAVVRQVARSAWRVLASRCGVTASAEDDNVDEGKHMHETRPAREDTALLLRGERRV